MVQGNGSLGGLILQSATAVVSVAAGSVTVLFSGVGISVVLLSVCALQAIATIATVASIVKFLMIFLRKVFTPCHAQPNDPDEYQAEKNTG